MEIRLWDKTTRIIPEKQVVTPVLLPKKRTAFFFCQVFKLVCGTNDRSTVGGCPHGPTGPRGGLWLVLRVPCWRWAKEIARVTKQLGVEVPKLSKCYVCVPLFDCNLFSSNSICLFRPKFCNISGALFYLQIVSKNDKCLTHPHVI